MSSYDGGYYAIKGFLYQFDKTMIELFSQEEDIEICVEKIQDINYENYVIQVKHKETATFSKVKIREPIIQLLELYKTDNNKKFCLYGHFKGEGVKEINISSVSELDEFLMYRDPEKVKEIKLRFPDTVKQGFIKNFKLYFSANFEDQFKYLIDLMREKLELPLEETIIQHSLIREKLLELAIKDDINERKTTRKEILDYLTDCKTKIFYNAYGTFLGRDKYIKLMKKHYFTHRGINIDRFERLFIIDCQEKDNDVVIQRIINRIKEKFYRKDKSPAPYVCLKSIKKEKLNNIKRNLLDDGTIFTDGTYFNGDKFRIDKLINSSTDICIKIINEENLLELVQKHQFREVYNLFINEPIDIKFECFNVEIQYEKLNEVEEMIG